MIMTTIVMANGTSPTVKAIPIYTPPIPMVVVFGVDSFPESPLPGINEYTNMEAG